MSLARKNSKRVPESWLVILITRLKLLVSTICPSVLYPEVDGEKANQHNIQQRTCKASVDARMVGRLILVSALTSSQYIYRHT